MKQFGIAMFAIIALLLTSTLFGSFYTIDEGQRGVELRNGKVIGVANPGLGFKTPFIESVDKISVQTQTMQYTGVNAYSKDQQTAVLTVSVTYHVPPDEVINLYTKFGTVDNMTSRLLNRQVPTQVENVFGQYNAVNAVQNRVKLVNDISAAIKANVIGPVVVDSVQVENIDFSEDYERSIALRMKAEVEVKTREQMLQTEQVQAQIAVTQAQAVADSQLAQAKAEAQAITLRGNAEAEAIKARAAALAQNGNLVELVKAEKWSGVLPTTMLPDGTIPFLDMRK
jgi:regulator of protease activity HflC (stomatin/prohibitin superfamily)